MHPIHLIQKSAPIYIDPPYSCVKTDWDRQKPQKKEINVIELKRAINGVFTEAEWNPTLQNTLKIDHAVIKIEPENYGEPLNILGEFSRMFMRLNPNIFQPVLVGHIFTEGFFDPITKKFYVVYAIPLSETENWKRILL